MPYFNVEVTPEQRRTIEEAAKINDRSPRQQFRVMAVQAAKRIVAKAARKQKMQGRCMIKPIA
jgi:uncharacterized protein (DUF1778 family)